VTPLRDATWPTVSSAEEGEGRDMVLTSTLHEVLVFCS
jgi:hypothetical protein